MISWRRWSPGVARVLAAAARSRPAPGRRSRRAARRCRRRPRRGRASRAPPAGAGAAARASRACPSSCSPLRSWNPCWSIRRSAALRSPWYSRSSDISASRASASRSNPTWVPSHREYWKAGRGMTRGYRFHHGAPRLGPRPRLRVHNRVMRRAARPRPRDACVAVGGLAALQGAPSDATSTCPARRSRSARPRRGTTSASS